MTKSLRKLSRKSSFCATALFGVVLLAIAPTYMTAATIQSLTSEPTTGLVLDQTVSTSTGITTRYTSSSDFRSITQTFTLASNTSVNGLGLVLAANQNTVGGTGFSVNQPYALDIQQLDASNTVLATLGTYAITVTTDLVAANNWLYITFDTSLSLTSGTKYGFNFRPTEIITNNNLELGRSSSDVYAGGVGNQYGTSGVISLGSAYGSSGSVGDITFALTSVPEPNSWILFSGAFMLLIVRLVTRKKTITLYDV